MVYHLLVGVDFITFVVVVLLWRYCWLLTDLLLMVIDCVDLLTVVFERPLIDVCGVNCCVRWCRLLPDCYCCCVRVVIAVTLVHLVRDVIFIAVLICWLFLPVICLQLCCYSVGDCRCYYGCWLVAGYLCGRYLLLLLLLPLVVWLLLFDCWLHCIVICCCSVYFSYFTWQLLGVRLLHLSVIYHVLLQLISINILFVINVICVLRGSWRCVVGCGVQAWCLRYRVIIWLLQLFCWCESLFRCLLALNGIALRLPLPLRAHVVPVYCWPSFVPERRFTLSIWCH